MKFLSTTSCAAIAFASAALADHQDEKDGPGRADGHAPIGVMGDHMHKAGEFMFSYRFMQMSMEGSRINRDEISPLEIAQTIPNIFNTELAIPGQPPTLRVVPTEMTMDMHMLGAMWAPSDDITLMAMGSYIIKEMDHVTFAGGVPAEELTNDDIIGGFTTQSEGFGDTTLAALFRWTETDVITSHILVGLSTPTASIDETDQVLAPNGATPTLRLPYPMQLGSGTFDPKLGYTISGRNGDLGYGVQGSAVWRLYDNDQDYQLGDEYALDVWGSYAFSPWLSASTRFHLQSVGDISGRDPQIVAPVQTANPSFQGGDRIDISVGVNWAGQSGLLKGQRLGAEVGVPVYQDLNGPQLETDLQFTLGWQYSF